MPYKIEFLAMTRHDPQKHGGRTSNAKVTRLTLGTAVLTPGAVKVLGDALYARLKPQIDRYVANGVARVTRINFQVGVAVDTVAGITQNIPEFVPEASVEVPVPEPVVEPAMEVAEEPTAEEPVEEPVEEPADVPEPEEAAPVEQAEASVQSEPVARIKRKSVSK